MEIAAACVGIISGLASLSSRLKGFCNHAINAPHEIAALRKEVKVFHHSLSHFYRDNLADQCPKVLKDDLVNIINECKGVLDRLDGLITGIDPCRLSGKVEWSSTIRDEVNRLRQNLETYKSAINIAATATSLSLNHSIKNDTSNIKDQVARISEIEELVYEIWASIQAPTKKSASRMKFDHAVQRFLETESCAGSVRGIPEAPIDDSNVVVDGGSLQPSDGKKGKRQLPRTEKTSSNSPHTSTASVNAVPVPVQQAKFVNAGTGRLPAELREQALSDEPVIRMAKEKMMIGAWQEMETSSKKRPGPLRKRARTNDLKTGRVDQTFDTAPRKQVDPSTLRKSKSSILITNWGNGCTSSEQVPIIMPPERTIGNVVAAQRDLQVKTNSNTLRSSKSFNLVTDKHLSLTSLERITHNERKTRETASHEQPFKHDNARRAIPKTLNSGIEAMLRSLRPSGWSVPREVTDSDFKLMAGLGTPSVSTPNLRLWDFADFKGHELYFEHDDNQASDLLGERLALESSFNHGWTKDHLRNTAERLHDVVIQHLKIFKPRATEEIREHWINLEIQLSTLKEGRWSLPKYRPAKSCMSIGIGHFLAFEHLGDCEYAYSQMVPYTQTYQASGTTWVDTFKDVRSSDEKLIVLFTIAATLSSMFYHNMDLLRLEGNAFGDCLGMAIFKAARMERHFSDRNDEPEALARRLYEMSASFGYIPALIELAECYSSGKGGPKDDDGFRRHRDLWNWHMYSNGFTVWNDSGNHLGTWHWKDSIPDEKMWDYHSRRAEGEAQERRLKKKKSRVSLPNTAKLWWYGS